MALRAVVDFRFFPIERDTEEDFGHAGGRERSLEGRCLITVTKRFTHSFLVSRDEG